jgi:Na+:H+ antiporter, NhaA family
MATDIAFVIGIMALLGDRVPLGPKVFLTALAIVNDIAAVLGLPLPYALLGIALWSAVLHSGVHATFAGVILALTIPTRTQLPPRISPPDPNHCPAPGPLRRSRENVALEDACEQAQPPLFRLNQALHRWVSFLIMPVFALANAGVDRGGDLSIRAAEPVTLGVAIGLLLGKPIGLTLLSWLASKSGWASLPDGVSWTSVHGAAWLGGA